jgi:hypothetical protein
MENARMCHGGAAGHLSPLGFLCEKPLGGEGDSVIPSLW